MRAQASRCMDCGIPFCHQGCPLGNLIPEWNDLVYKGKLDEASNRLLATNNFPEVTGRVCPAPCEASCVLNINGEPVTIKTVERTIADYGFAHGAPFLARPHSNWKAGRRRGLGPAGLAAAQQLARAGHDVVVFERDDRVGGLLRYGIPDFKMEKDIIDARIDQMRAEGVTFRAGVDVGGQFGADRVVRDFDAVVLAMGARTPRDLRDPRPRARRGSLRHGVSRSAEPAHRGRYTRFVERDPGDRQTRRSHRGWRYGIRLRRNSLRQGAVSVTQLELMPKPHLVRVPTNPWPEWPLVLRTSSSQEEGATRLGGLDARLPRRGRTGRRASTPCVFVRRGQDASGRGSRFADSLRTRSAGHGLRWPGAARAGRRARLALDARGNVRTDGAARRAFLGFSPRATFRGDSRSSSGPSPMVAG